MLSGILKKRWASLITLLQIQIQGKNFSRSLYVSEDVKKGDLVTTKNVRSVCLVMECTQSIFLIFKRFLRKIVEIGTRVDESLLNKYEFNYQKHYMVFLSVFS